MSLLTNIVCSVANTKTDASPPLHQTCDQRLLAWADSAADHCIAVVAELQKEALILRQQGHSQSSSLNDKTNCPAASTANHDLPACLCSILARLMGGL